MIGESPCDSYNLGNITLTIDQMDYVIPPAFYTQELDVHPGMCEFLFQANFEQEAELKDKYILGLPFVRAFMVMFDYN
jgi:hypothetical protein